MQAAQMPSAPGAQASTQAPQQAPQPAVQPFPSKPTDEQLLAQFPPGSQVLPDPAVAPSYNGQSTMQGNYPTYRNQYNKEPDCCIVM